MKQMTFLSNDNLIRIGQIQHELAAIEQGYTDMLSGNETITDRLLSLAFELVALLNGERR